MNDRLNILRKYNFWDNSAVSPGFIRQNYLDKLVSFTGNRLIKVITGQRRCGKSYLLRQFIFQLHRQGIERRNILYINKEFNSFDFIRNSNDLEEVIHLFLRELKPHGRIYLIFDEIQQIENWEKIVNSYSQDYTAEYEVFISGSNASLLSGELATFLTGRYVGFNVFPYSYGEYCQVTDKVPGKATFIDYLAGGGLPELFNLPDNEVRHHYVQALKNTILLKDIVVKYNIKDASLLESLFSFIVQNISNPVSVTNIVNFYRNLKVVTSFNTLSSYLKYLEQTFLLHAVSRYDLKGKKILGGTRKYYLNDLAFRNILFSEFEPGLGYLLENLVFLEFKRNGYEVMTGAERNMEIDFMIKKNGIIKYVQVCYILTDENIIQREFGNLESIKDNWEKMVISLDDISLGNRNGIMHYPAWNTEIYH
jgi:predicted AAA+ superfamily ATPase